MFIKVVHPFTDSWTLEVTKLNFRFSTTMICQGHWTGIALVVHESTLSAQNGTWVASSFQRKRNEMLKLVELNLSSDHGFHCRSCSSVYMFLYARHVLAHIPLHKVTNSWISLFSSKHTQAVVQKSIVASASINSLFPNVSRSTWNHQMCHLSHSERAEGVSNAFNSK